jgi:predicted metal-binding membrane protein
LTGDSALRRDRLIVLSALLLLSAFGWIYVIWLAADMALAPAMPGMSSMMAPAFAPWRAVHFLFLFAMWLVMMVGMMTPSVAPVALIYAQVARHAASLGQAFASVGWFVAGYLLAWTLFSVLAALAQWGLESLALITPMMMSASRPFGALVLIVAGAYQWLPIKDSCLSQCRAPLSFVQRHGGFQPRAPASLRLGFTHGMYCIGCCWALMLLLFVGGVMNLLWIAALMIFALLERLIPGGRMFSRLAGLGAMTAGVWMFAR